MKERPIEPVELYVYNAVVHAFREYFNVPATHLYRATNGFQAAKQYLSAVTANMQESKQVQAKAKDLKFPVLLIAITNWEVYKEAYNISALGRHYSYGDADPETKIRRAYHILPVRFGCEIVYMDNDFKRMDSFINNWMLGVVNRSVLNRNVLYDGITLTTITELDPNINAPRVEVGPERPSFSQIETTCSILGYVSKYIGDTYTIQGHTTQMQEMLPDEYEDRFGST